MSQPDERMTVLQAREKSLVSEINSAQSNLEDVRRMMRRIWEESNSPTITCADDAFEINPSWWRKNHPEQFPESMGDEDVVAKWRRILTDEWDRRNSTAGSAPEAK